MLKRNGLVYLLVFLFISQASFSQTYSFTSRSISDYYEIQTLNDGLYCLYNGSNKKDVNTTFRKTILNQDLAVVDTASYKLDGKANLLASCQDERFVTHAFYSKANGVEKIVFVVTDFTGRVQNIFSKTAADFSNCFARPLKKLKYFGFSFVPNNGTPGMLIIQPLNFSGTVPVSGNVMAIDALTGNKIWTCLEPGLSKIRTTENLLIGLISNDFGYNTMPSYQVGFIDKNSGSLIKKIPFEVQGKGFRTVPVFTTNGIQLMAAGSEYESPKGKDGKFYMAMYSLTGDKIFDQVDSSSVLSSKRLHIMGKVFDQEGNLVLIGEGWKPDATRMIASTATSVALTLLSGGSYAYISGGGVDHKVENVVFATMSPNDGRVKNLKTFPVGPWLNYGRLLTEGGHVLFLVNGQVLIYDVDNGNEAPSMLTTLGANENLMLMPSGPIVVKKNKKQCVLSKLH